MRIFLTGGTGYVGSAVLDALVRAGHQVDALVRNSEKAAQVQARGGHPVLGDLVSRRRAPTSRRRRRRRRPRRVRYSARGPQVDAAALDVLLAPRGGGSAS